MKEIAQISEIHSIILEIAKIFHKICLKHRIPYYMLGGTMLGAVRHNGFIPWDDDMDFGVPRLYYNDLINILKEELPDYLSCITHYDNYGVSNEIVKISDNRTIIEESNKGYIRNKMGLFIDVFPLDESDNNWKRCSRNWFVAFILDKRNSRYYPQRNLWGRFMQMIVLTTPKQLQKKILRWVLPKQGDYYSNYSGAWGPKETISKEYFGVPKLYQFEDVELYGVQNPHMYLTNLYGDYMQIPPDSQRHVHLIKTYWK